MVKLSNGRLYGKSKREDIGVPEAVWVLTKTSGVHRVVAPPGGQAKYPRHSCVYFARPNGHVVLKPLIGEVDEDEKQMTADEWIAHRAILRNTANYKGLQA